MTQVTGGLTHSGGSAIPSRRTYFMNGSARARREADPAVVYPPEPPMSGIPHIINSAERATAMSRAERIDAIETEIRARTPRPAARLHISLSNPPIRTVYQTQMRISGNRDDVLDFTAALYDEVKGMVRPDGTLPIAVQSIESESSEHIQLLLTRDLYEG